MNPRESGASAKAYYTEEARQDYYSEGQEILGNWGGKGAARLGLHGTVDRESFISLCDNQIPGTHDHLTPRTRTARTCGYDLNFHCPKSVSLVHAWTGDHRIVEAFLESVRETMQELERQIRTRVRKDGVADGDRLTKELIWAEFLHLTARPEEKIPDPHLHVHCFTFNATFDGMEDRWKAGQFREIMRNAPYYQAAFMTRLANKLMALGYKIRPVDKAFEIEGVPDTLNRQFSKRTKRINKTAAELGVTDPKEKDKLGALTRKAKNSVMAYSELRKHWREAASPEDRLKMEAFLKAPLAGRLGQAERRPMIEPAAEETPIRPGKGSLAAESARSLLGSGKTTTGKLLTPPDPAMEREALDRSILHNFYRASVVTEMDILTHAMRLGYGTHMTPEGLREAMKKHPEFIFREIGGTTFVTTRTVLAEEQANVQWVKEGKGTLSPILTGHQIRDQRLNDEQRAAVQHVLESKDRVTAVEGKSGTGKTLLMKEAVAAMEAAHHPVLVLAPGTQAVQETLRKGAFPNAQTVEQLLVNEKLQEEFRNGVWWVDEAGQLSARSMHRLFDLAEKQNARIVLSGDVGQHRAVERGDAMRSLYEHAELKPAYVTKIQRQSGNYRENIELLSQGRVAEAFRKMDADGCIHEMPFHERYKAIAELYVQSANEGARPFVVAPTHEEGRMVTQEIRAKLKADGELKQERPIDVLKEIDMSPAERADWRTYRPGWIIELMRATPGTQAGTRMVIDSIDYSSGDIYVKKPDGATRRWDVQEYVDRFQVYQSDSVALAPGDRIRITKNGRAEYGKSKVFNGSLHTLTGFDEHGDLKLDNGMVISREFAHLNYGYATTSHAAQSKTVNHVIVAESAVSFAAGSREQFYVSTSRGRKRLDVFTNNKAELLEAVEPSSQRRSAMELVAKESDEKPLPEDYREELRLAQERAELKLAHKSEPAKARKKDKQPLRESLGARQEPPMPRQEEGAAKLLKATPPDLSQPPAMTKAKVHEKEIEPEIEPDMEP